MFEERVSLARHSNYKIGGSARYFFEARSIDEIQKAITVFYSDGRHSDAVFILGSGTNILFNDAGFDGLVLKPNLNYIKPTTSLHSQVCKDVIFGDAIELMVGAGTQITQLLNYTIAHGLSGLEWAGGLPGTLGGAIRGNAGCFGGETKDIVVSVNVLEIKNHPSTKLRTSKSKIKNYTNEECKFGYRTSVFKEPTLGLRKSKGLTKSKHCPFSSEAIILEAILVLKKGDKKKIRKAIQEKIAYRNARHPMEYPNIGSIFKNIPITQISADKMQMNADRKTIRVNLRSHPRKSALLPVKTDPFPIIPTAYLISEAGLKGVSFGGAIISPKHPNFIVNAQSATAKDVKQLISLVKSSVKKKFGIELEEEVQIV